MNTATGRRDTNGARSDALESEIGALKSEVARLRQQLRRQNALLRPLLLSQRLRPLRLPEYHEALPVTVSTLTTVDLSCIDTSLVAQVASYVGTSRELLNLALTCKSFGWWQPGSELNWSLAEEVARRAVFSGQDNINGVRVSLPGDRYVRGVWTWLSILREFERPLKFNTLCELEHSSSDRTSVRATEEGDYGSALANGYVMVSGIHYAEFQIRGCPYIGIVRPIPIDNLRTLAIRGLDIDFFENTMYDYFLATRCEEWGDGIVHACEISCDEGDMRWTDWDRDTEWEEWDGMEDIEFDDAEYTIGMLLNFAEGTLTVFNNNRRLGVMKDGLSGSYCWYTRVWVDGTVTIKGGEPPMHRNRRVFEDSDDSDSMLDVSNDM